MIYAFLCEVELDYISGQRIVACPSSKCL